MPPREEVPPGRLWAWVAIPVALAVFGALLLLIWGERRRGTQYADDRFEVSGELLPDGTCVVLLDGVPMDTGPALRTEYERASAINVAPEGWETHEIECGTPFVDGRRRSLSLWGATREGRPMVTGTYGIVEDAVEQGRASQWEGTLFHPRFDAERAYLEGYGGTLTITRADSPVVGTFRFVARRKRRSPFSLSPAPPPRDAPPAPAPRG
jgi:hypothetical protein